MAPLEYDMSNLFDDMALKGYYYIATENEDRDGFNWIKAGDTSEIGEEEEKFWGNKKVVPKHLDNMYTRMRWTLITQQGFRSYEVRQGENYWFDPLKPQAEEVAGVFQYNPWKCTVEDGEAELIRKEIQELEFLVGANRARNELYLNAVSDHHDIYKRTNVDGEPPWDSEVGAENWFYVYDDSEQMTPQVKKLTDDITSRWGRGMLFIHKIEVEELPKGEENETKNKKENT